MSRITHPKSILLYEDENGNSPFSDWLYKLRDTKARKRIIVRIGRLEQGNYGDCEPVGDGISELRMFFGPGYRVYFAEKGKEIIILCGGDKSSQTKDIKSAKLYWKEYKENG